MVYCLQTYGVEDYYDMKGAAYMREDSRVLHTGTQLQKQRNIFLRVFEKIKYEFFIVVFIVIQFLPRITDFSEDAYATMFVLDYKFGIAPRLFMGSVLSFFTDYKGREELNIFFSALFALSFILIAVVLGGIIRSANTDMESSVLFLVALFLAGPFSMAFTYAEVFAPDRILAMFAIFSVLVMTKRGFRWVVPLLTLAALATYHMYTLAYIPGIAILLLFHLHKSRYSFMSILYCITNYVVMIAGTVYFFFFSAIQTITPPVMIEYAQSKTDILVREDMIGAYLFDSATGFADTALELIIVKNVLSTAAEVAIYMLPLIVLFNYIWISAFKACTNRFEKFLFILCALAPLARIPLLFIQAEVYRARIGVVIVQFSFLFYFLYYRNEAVVAAVKRVVDFFRNNLLLMLLFIGYFSSLYAASLYNRDLLEPFRKLIWS